MDTTRTVTVNLSVNEAIHFWQDKNQLTLVITEIDLETLEINGLNPLELLSSLKYYFKNLNLEEVTDIELYIQQLKDIQLSLNNKLNTYEKQTLTAKENKL
jgi:hypothetical protein